jgi:hypothetical protein
LSAAPQLVFTDEQLTLLALLAGEPGFPATPAPELDAAAWTAVAQGLVARGLIHDDEPSVEVRLADAVLGVALFADRSLSVTSVEPQDEDATRQEILWLKGELAVRQTRSAAGFHHFSTGTISEPPELPPDLAAAGRSPPAPARPLSEAELADELFSARRVISVEAGRRHSDGAVTGERLTFVESAEHGLLLLGDADDGSAVLEPITPDGARERVASLAASLG